MTTTSRLAQAALAMLQLQNTMTKQIYYEQPYATELDVIVVSVDKKGAHAQVQLSATLAYPQGGGQPSDIGEISGPTGKLRIETVSFKDGVIIHQGKLHGTLVPGDAVHLQIKWSRRHHNMRCHTAGHALHEAVLSLTDALVPVRANHGSDAYIEYAGTFSGEVREEIERRVNEMVASNLPVVMRESSFEEIRAKCRFIPAGLPTNKPLRTVQIGGRELVPCGGIHVRALGEVGRIIVAAMERDPKSGNTILKYRISKAEEKTPASLSPCDEICLGGPS